MPLQWDPETHAQNLKESQAKEATRIALLAAARSQQNIIPHTYPAGTCESTMRNWVIKTLCGMRVLILDRFATHFPELTVDLVKLDEHVGDVIHKARQANHKYTKK